MPNVEMSGIEFQIVGQADAAAKGVKSLASSLRSLKQVTDKGLGLKAVVEDIRGFNNGLSDLKTTSIVKLGTAFRDLAESSKSLTKVASSLARLGNSSDGLNAVREQLVAMSHIDFSNLENLPTVLNGAKKSGTNTIPSGVLAQSQPQIALPVVSDNVKSTSRELEVVGEYAAEASAKVAEAGRAAKGSSEQMSRLRIVLTGVRDAFKKSVSPMSKFVSSLARVATYRILRTILKSITDALKTGINNIYEYSRVAGTAFAPSMDAAKSSLTTFKNSIGAAVAPLIQSLIPALRAACSLLITFNNLLGSFFAALSGKSNGMFTAAIEFSDTFGESLKSAGGAAKELLSYLLPIDELNVMPDANSGGGGGGAELPDYSSMFEEREISTKVQKLANFIKGHLQEILTLVGAIAAGLLAWKIASVFTNDLSKLAGIFLTVSGLVLGITSGIDAWKNGVDRSNLIGMLTGAAAVIGGLALAFGSVGAGIGALVTGFAMLTVGIRDWIKTGELSTDTFWLLEGAIGAVGLGLGLLVSPWAAVAAAAVGAGLAIYKNWDRIPELVEQAGAEIGDATRTAAEVEYEQNVHLWENIKKVWNDGWENIKRKTSESWESIKSKIFAKWSEIKETTSGKLSALKEDMRDGWESIKKTATEKWDALHKKVSEIWEKIKQTVKDGVEKLKGFLKFDWKLPDLKLPHFSISGEFSLNPPSIPHISVDWYAKGGFPDEGSLFVARESGAEMVGSIGNRTAVANNDQIVESVSRGVYEAVVAAMSGQNSNNHIHVYIDGREITDSQNRTNRRYGKTLQLV